MRRLEKEGYTCFRMAGSHTKVDIIAIKLVQGSLVWDLPIMVSPSYRDIRYIQSKPKGGYLSPKERKEKAALEGKLGINIEVL
jgi:hypothetical protein